MLSWRNALALQKEQLNRLLEHKYKSNGESLCDKLFKGFWESCSRRIPQWIAPNTLTFVGLMANVAAVFLLTSYGLTSFSLLFFAASVFVYQTLDALDGLHARQTNSCSHLGELFDHGCDALSIALLSLGFILVIGLDSWPILMFVQYFTLTSLFYLSHWRCYVTGVLTFDRLGVTEAQVTCIIFSVISSMLGVSFWTTAEPLLGLELRIVQFLIFMVIIFFLLVSFSDVISQGGCGKYGTTIANTSILFPGCPLGLIIGLALLIAIRSPSNIYNQSPCLYLLCFGIIQAKVSQRLVVAHMTKSAISLFDTSMLGPFILLVNQYFSCPLSEYVILWMSFIWAVTDIFIYDAKVCIQFADFLNIYIFRVDRPSSKQQQQISSGASIRPNQKFSTANSNQGHHFRNSHYLRNSTRKS